ncbi:hypothetical protein BFGS084_04244 [Bacteroides fragilis]|nr:hypothetical protein BFGS084_04244 [Bacteroides fragilis]
MKSRSQFYDRLFYFTETKLVSIGRNSKLAGILFFADTVSSFISEVKVSSILHILLPAFSLWG